MFLAIDGTDQLDNGIPQFREITKDDAGQHRLKVHLEVVEIAGAPRTMYVYTVPENIPGDSNTTAEVLHRTLKKEEIRRGGTYPPVLYLQMDNCSATNKNSYIIALDLLVDRTWGLLNRFSVFSPGRPYPQRARSNRKYRLEGCEV